MQNCPPQCPKLDVQCLPQERHTILYLTSRSVCVCVLQAGVKFQSPHDGSEMVLTPEHSVEIQNTIGETIS